MGLFNHFFQNANLIDVVPLPLTLAWRNGRKCVACVPKHLDRFFMDYGLSNNVDRFKSWVVNVSIYDHMLLCLKFEVDSYKILLWLEISGEIWLSLLIVL